MPTVHFTSQTIKGLTAGSSVRTDYFDTDVTGFGLRVTASGVKTWVYLYRIHGRPRRYTIGRYPDLSLADARDRAKAARNDVAHGADPSTTKVELRRAETFGELADLFIQDYAKPRKRTWEIDQGDIAHELRQWRHVKATEIKRRDVIALLKAIADRPAPIKANRIQSLIRKIYNFAIGRDLVETNPCAEIVPFGKEHRRTRVLSEDEIVQFWESAEAHWRAATGTSVGAILQLELLTAQRGKVRWMRWSDLDVANGWWTLPGEFAKNGTTSRVTLNRMVVRLLRELHALGVARHAAINEGRARKDSAPKPMSVWCSHAAGRARQPWRETIYRYAGPITSSNRFVAPLGPSTSRRTTCDVQPRREFPSMGRRRLAVSSSSGSWIMRTGKSRPSTICIRTTPRRNGRSTPGGRYLERLLRRTSLRRVG